MLVIMNKVDKVDKQRIEEVTKLVREKGFEVAAKISALKGWGVDLLLKLILEELGRRGFINKTLLLGQGEEVSS
ncbi:MAG: hypothetical protein DRO12_05975, partial [Thermoprotei archaeon]